MRGLNPILVSRTITILPGASQIPSKRTRWKTEKAPVKKDFRNFFFVLVVVTVVTLVLVIIFLFTFICSGLSSTGVSMVCVRRSSSFVLREI